MERYSDIVFLNYDCSTDITLYTAVSAHSKAPVNLQFLPITTEPAALLQSVQIHLQALSHRYIRQVFDSFSYTDENRVTYLVLALEQCECSFAQLAENQNGVSIEETKLRTWLDECVEALAFTQQKVQVTQGISHRNITPEAIFIAEDGHVRIWGFDVVEGDSLRLSIPEKPLYISPEQRRLIIPQSRSPEKLKIDYDVFKSDVFTLGYTFLVLALLRDSKCGRVINGLDINVAIELSSLPHYSIRFREVLRSMLYANPSSRPSFLTFNSDLSNPQSSPPERLLDCVTGQHKDVGCEGNRVELSCGHSFCTQSCFREYVYNATEGYGKTLEAVECPDCRRPVKEDEVWEAFGSAEEFATQQAELSLGCMICNREAYTCKRFFCNHHICQTDWRKLHKPSVCPQCHSPLNPQAKVPNCQLF